MKVIQKVKCFLTITSTIDSSELVNYTLHKHGSMILFLSRLQSHWTVFSSWMLYWTYYTIFQHHNLIWEHLQKICNTFFPFSALDLWASPHQALFHSFCDILSGKPLETLLKDQKIDQKISPINDIINRSLNYLLICCINQFF